MRRKLTDPVPTKKVGVRDVPFGGRTNERPAARQNGAVPPTPPGSLVRAGVGVGSAGVGVLVVLSSLVGAWRGTERAAVFPEGELADATGAEDALAEEMDDDASGAD